MTNVEKNCHRTKSGRIAFSSDSVVWICRCQVYISILRYYIGLTHSRGNLKRMVRGCEIKDCLGMILREIQDRLKICKDKCKYFFQHGHRYRRKHLNNRLVVAQERYNEEAKSKILSVIQREKDGLYWHRLNYLMSKPRGHIIRVVQTSTLDG